MRLTLATLLLVASSPTWAGDLLVADGPAADPAAAGSPAAGAPAAKPTAPKPALPYAGLYEAPLFGHVAPPVDKVDETALRFYAAGKNRTRVDAEIRRLRALHPAWKVPANLYATGAGNDEQPLWDLFAAGRTEELRSAIQGRERREAGWRPSADLLAKMARQETATALKGLSEAHDWARLLSMAAAHPDLLGCATVDLDWRVAEAFAGIGATERASEVDAAILKACKDRDERLATVLKAVDLLPGSAVDRLIAAGDTLADGSGEFDGVRLDLARRELGRATAAALPAAGAAAVEVSPASLDALGNATLRTGEPADAALLGWYEFRRGRWAEADGWFKLGLQASGDAKMAEGHALALRELGRLEEAEPLAHAWRERSPVMRGLFVSLMTARLGQADASSIDPAEMADFSAILLADRSAPAAGALGWTAYGRGDYDAAALWFGRAIDWTGAAGLPEKVAEGYGLTLKSLGRFDAAEDFLYARRDLSAAARDLYVAVAVAALSGPPPALVGPELPPAEVAPERMDRFAEVIRAARSPQGATAMGWRDLRDGRPDAAIGWFHDAAEWSAEGKPVDLKTVEGLVLALKDVGRLGEAEETAYARARDSARLREAYRGIMAAELTTPATAARLTPERVARFAATVEAESSSPGAEALGWYRLGQEGCGYGVDWFRRALAWSADGRGTAKGAEGYAQALARAGHDLEADDIASAWADRAPDLRALDVKLMAEAVTRELFPPRIDEGRLGRFSALVRAERSAGGAQAIAWHRYRAAGMGYGVDWFEDAIRWSPDRRADAKTMEGYASALRDVGRLADAEEVLYPWVDKVAVMRDLYIDTMVSELTLDNPPEPMPQARMARFVAVATPLRSAAAAQAIGWYRFARREFPDAAAWFKLAVDWWPALPTDADRYSYVPEGFIPLQAHVALAPGDYRRTPRAYTSRAHGPDASEHRYVTTFGGLATTWMGYALSLDAVGRTAEAEDIAFAWRDRWPALRRLFVDLAARALTRGAGACGGAGIAVDPARLKRYAAAIEEERDAGGAAALGWAAAARHDPAEAVVWLKAANDWRPAESAVDGRAMAGYVDALRASGRPDEAYAAAAAWADSVPEVKAALLDAALDLLAAAGGTSKPADPAAGAADPAPRWPAPQPSPEALAGAIALAKADGSARGPSALGWHYLGAGQPALALPLFRVAVTRAGDAAPSDGSALAPAPAADGCPALARTSDAAVLPKAVEGFALALRAAGRDADALTFTGAWAAKVPALSGLPGDIVADVLGRDAGRGAVAPELIDRMAATAVRGRSARAAAAFGWYAYGRRDWAKAADWFAEAAAWSPDRRGPVEVAEGYAASLHNQCRFEEAERVALSRPGEDGEGRLRKIYVDSVADRIGRARPGLALEPSEASRFAAATVAVSSANGAQALGWYAYRSRQFGAAAAWFEKALTWRVTEAQVYGLALSERRAGDAAGLARVLDRYEGRFASLAAVRRAGMKGREPPVPHFDDLARRGCAGPDAADASADRTGSIGPAAPWTAEPEAAARPAEPARPRPVAVAAADSAPLYRSRPIAVVSVQSGADGEPVRRAAPARHPEPLRRTASAARPAPAAEEDATARGPAEERAAPPPPTPSGTAAAALAAKDYGRCLALLARRPALGAADRETQGWCLLGQQRPAEAAEAFRVAGAGGRGRVASDSALGETLSHLREGDTRAAVDSAARTRLGADRRRTLGLQILSQQAYDAYRGGRYDETLDILRRRSAFAGETRDVVMLRGWAEYGRGDYDAARAAFSSADGQLSDRDSRNALSTLDVATTRKAFR